MWLIVFILVCSVPLIILGLIGIWRKIKWEKQNENIAA